MTIPEAIEETRSNRRFRDRSPEEINSGLCLNFARAAMKKIASKDGKPGGGVQLAGDDRVAGPQFRGEILVKKKWAGCGHVWILGGGHCHYDVNFPNGVEQWHLLFF